MQPTEGDPPGSSTSAVSLNEACRADRGTRPDRCANRQACAHLSLRATAIRRSVCSILHHPSHSQDFPASHHRRPGSRSTRVPCLISSTAFDGHPVLPGNHVLQRSCTAMRRRLCDAGFRHNFGFSTHDRYRRGRAARQPAVLTLDVESRESIVEKENLPGAPTPTMRLNGRDSALRSALTARSIESRMAAMTPQRTIQFGD